MIRLSLIFALKNLLLNSISPIIYFSLLKPTIQWVLVCWWCSTSISISNYKTCLSKNKKTCLSPPQETHICKESLPISSFHYALVITYLLSASMGFLTVDISCIESHTVCGHLCLPSFLSPAFSEFIHVACIRTSFLFGVDISPLCGYATFRGLPRWCQQWRVHLPTQETWERGVWSFPWWGRSPGGRHDSMLQHFCLENPMGRGAWWAIIRRVTKSQTWLKWLSMHVCPTSCVFIYQ